MTGLDYLGISWTSQFQNGPSLFKLFQAYYDVTTGHMTLRIEIFWRNCQLARRKQASLVRENTQFCAESSGITACLWIQVWIGHPGVYRRHFRDVKGRLFVSCIWCS